MSTNQFKRSLDARTRKEQVLEYLNKQHICTSCGVEYTQMENIGRLQCKYHPEALKYDLARKCKVWRCCNREYDEDDIGCCKCDHCEDNTHDERINFEPLEMFDIVGGYIPMPIEESSKGVVLRHKKGSPGEIDERATVVRFSRFTRQQAEDDEFEKRHREKMAEYTREKYKSMA